MRRIGPAREGKGILAADAVSVSSSSEQAAPLEAVVDYVTSGNTAGGRSDTRDDVSAPRGSMESSTPTERADVNVAGFKEAGGIGRPGDKTTTHNDALNQHSTDGLSSRCSCVVM